MPITVDGLFTVYPVAGGYTHDDRLQPLPLRAAIARAKEEA